jgi:hypothetical protein
MKEKCPHEDLVLPIKSLSGGSSTPGSQRRVSMLHNSASPESRVHEGGEEKDDLISFIANSTGR